MDFAELLTQYRIPFHASGSKTRQGWINLQCPWCDKDPYLGYNISGRYVSCWNCGRHGLTATIKLLTGLSQNECVDLIGELPHDFVGGEKLRAKGQLVLPTGLGPLGTLHRDYLRERGLSSRSLIKLWEIAGIGQFGGLLRWRIFIPIYFNNQLVSWTTRAIGDRRPRYWSARDSESLVPIENLLYGIDYVRNTVIVCEGPVDVWALGPGAVAVLGLRTSPSQLEQLSRVPKRVICFDAEPNAQHRARRLLNDLSVFDGETVNVVLESGKDAAEASEEEVRMLRSLL